MSKLTVEFEDLKCLKVFCTKKPLILQEIIKIFTKKDKVLIQETKIFRCPDCGSKRYVKMFDIDKSMDYDVSVDFTKADTQL